VNFVVLTYVALKTHALTRRDVYKLIGVSVVSLAIIGNLPAARNYINYGVFRPTDVLANNMLNYLAYKVLMSEGKVDEYSSLEASLRRTTGVRELIEKKEKAALEVFRHYPVTTVAQMVRNAIGIMGRGHWTIAAGFWGYNFEDTTDVRFMVRRKSKVVAGVEMVFNALYLVIYVLFCGYLVRLWQLRNWGMLVTILLLVPYFLIPTFMVHAAGSKNDAFATIGGASNKIADNLHNAG